MIDIWSCFYAVSFRYLYICSPFPDSGCLIIDLVGFVISLIILEIRKYYCKKFIFYGISMAKSYYLLQSCGIDLKMHHTIHSTPYGMQV